MKKRSKKYQSYIKKVDTNKKYSVNDALEILCKNKNEKFNASIDLVFNLNLSKKNEHILRGFFKMPFPRIKDYKICVFTEKFLNETSSFDLFLTGGKELVDQIAKDNKINFDLVLATPEMMSGLKKIGKLLGTKKLMPSDKMGTLNLQLKDMISAWKKGRTTYQVDSLGNLHLSIGKANDETKKLLENFNFCFSHVLKIKPSGVKGKYIKSIHLSSTMSPSLSVQF